MSLTTDRSALADALSKVPAVTLGFWIIKDPGDDAGRNRRRRGQHELAWRNDQRCHRLGLSDRHGDIRGAADGADLVPDRRPTVPPAAVLGDDHRQHHRRHDAGRLL